MPLFVGPRNHKPELLTNGIIMCCKVKHQISSKHTKRPQVAIEDQCHASPEHCHMSVRMPQDTDCVLIKSKHRAAPDDTQRTTIEETLTTTGRTTDPRKQSPDQN